MKEINKLNIKYKPFSYFKEKYLHKLKEANSLIEPLNVLCGGWSLQTFSQVINKLSANKSSPLPLYFPSVESMDLISKNRSLLKEIFKCFDSREIGRVDACQIYCAFMIVSKGAYESFLRAIVQIFGFEYQGRIGKQEFFFFIDSLFRALPKIIIIKGFEKPIEPNVRLDFKEINGFIQAIFGGREEIQRNQIYQALLGHKELNQFIKYVQKKCTTSAELCRFEIIERVNIEAEVRGCLAYILERIDQNLRNQSFQRVLVQQ